MNIGQNQYEATGQSGQQVGYYQGYGKNGAVKSGYAKNGGGGSGSGEDQVNGAKSEETKSYREQILEKMEEMAQNIRKGTIQPKFQIGAQAYTIKEWEKLLEKFDAAEEALREEVQAQIEEREEQAEKEALVRAAQNGEADPEKTTSVSDAAVVQTAGNAAGPSVAQTAGDTTASGTVQTAGSAAEPTIDETAALLTDEVTKCSYPTDDPKQKHWYITCYGQDGISCKEAYFDGTRWVNKDLWSFSYTAEGQYEKVMAFLQRFPQDANLRFAAHENFWKDFLAGEIDEDDFAAFFATTKDGVPDYTYEKDGSTYIDREKAKYAKYMNGFGARLYTAEEMELIIRGVLEENKKRLGHQIENYPNMPISGDGGKQPNSEEDDIKTQMVTKPDGSTVLQITTSYGVMEIEITEAQKFGLMLDLGRSGGRGSSMPASGGYNSHITNT